MLIVFVGVSWFDSEWIWYVASLLIEFGCALHVLVEFVYYDCVDWVVVVLFLDDLCVEFV